MPNFIVGPSKYQMDSVFLLRKKLVFFCTEVQQFCQNKQLIELVILLKRQKTVIVNICINLLSIYYTRMCCFNSLVPLIYDPFVFAHRLTAHICMGI